MASEAMIISGRMSAGVRSAGFQAGLSPLLNRAISTISDDEEVCPKCGGHPPYCCGYQDSTSISSSAYERFQSALNKQQNTDKEKEDSTSLSSQPGQTQYASQPEDESGMQSVSDFFSQANKSDNSGSPGDEKTEPTAAGADEEKSESSSTPSAYQELSKDETKEVEELKKRDTEVRQHEQAHLAAAGHLASGGAQYEYEKGPDGRQYATGGHVSISVGGGNEPEERIRNAQQAERAALAPAEPSAQDRKVAAEARQVATEAQKEINEERASQATESEETNQTDAEQTKQTEQADPTAKKAQPEKETRRDGITSPSESEEQPEESIYPTVAPVDVNPFAKTDTTPAQSQPGETSDQPTSAMGVQGETSPFTTSATYHRQSPAADAYGENENHSTSDGQGNQNGIMSGNQNGESLGQAAWGNGIIQANSMQQSGMMQDDNGPMKRAADAYKRNSSTTSSSPSTKKLAEFTTRSGALFNRVA